MTRYLLKRRGRLAEREGQIQVDLLAASRKQCEKSTLDLDPFVVLFVNGAAVGLPERPEENPLAEFRESLHVLEKLPVGKRRPTAEVPSIQ
jgi:hypothetical protein